MVTSVYLTIPPYGGQTSILVNWCYIIDLYICRLHASPFELEYKAVGLPCIPLIKIRWTNGKKDTFEDSTDIYK